MFKKLLSAAAGCLSLVLISCGVPTPPTDDSSAAIPAAPVPDQTAAVPGESALDDPCNFPHDDVVSVGDAGSLREALDDARAGTLIKLAPGTYSGGFTIDASGSADAPVVVCGPREAVLTASGVSSGYALHLDEARHVVISGVTVTGAKKGIVLDRSSKNLLTGLLVHGVGQEAVQLRRFSTDNVISYSEFRDTGLHAAAYGEAVSIGTSRGRWEDVTGSSTQPDRSDRNQVLNNSFGPGVRAEHVDAREGTSDGILSGNRFDGEGIAGLNGADSWVELKGNGYRVLENSGANAPADGFQVKLALAGWGRDNLFSRNVASVNGPGYGFAIDQGGDGNRVLCDNRVGHAGSGFANIRCDQASMPPPNPNEGADDDDDGSSGGEDDGSSDDDSGSSGDGGADDDSSSDEDGATDDTGDGDGDGSDGDGDGSDGEGSDGGTGSGDDGMDSGDDGSTTPPAEPAPEQPAPQPGNPPSDGSLDPSKPPSGNFDLRRWYITLPSGSTVQPSELSNGYTKENVFYTDKNTGGMVFQCPNLAGTTANSKYSRTELREMRSGGGSAKADENNWTTSDGGTLRATLRVDRTSTTGDSHKVGRLVIGQIHGVDAEPIRLYYDKKPHEARGRIYGGYDSASNSGSWTPDIVPNKNGEGIALGEVFEYEIRLVGTRLTVWIRTGTGAEYRYGYDIDPAYRGENLYFKAGAYNQNNTGDSSDYVKVTFFRLNVAHP